MNNYLDLYNSIQEIKKISNHSYFFKNFNNEVTDKVNEFLTCSDCFFNIPILKIEKHHIEEMNDFIKQFEEFLKSINNYSNDYSSISEDSLIMQLKLAVPEVVSKSILLTIELG